MKSIRQIIAAISVAISVALQRRSLAKAIRINERPFLYKRHEGRSFYGFEYVMPDGTTEQYWRPAECSAATLLDLPNRPRARKAIARREIRTATNEPWHIRVPFDKREYNPYSPRSHR